MVDHETIYLPFGLAEKLAKKNGISASTICRYLKGQYRDNNPNIETIEDVRKQARAFGGVVVWATRNADGVLKYWNIKPRKIPTIGEWRNILSDDDADQGYVVPEWLSPIEDIEWECNYPRRIEIRTSHD